jgi:hypothetical protein
MGGDGGGSCCSGNEKYIFANFASIKVVVLSSHYLHAIIVTFM